MRADGTPGIRRDVDRESVVAGSVVAARGDEQCLAVARPHGDLVVVVTAGAEPAEFRSIRADDVDLLIETTAGRDLDRDDVLGGRPHRVRHLVGKRRHALRPTTFNANGPQLRRAREVTEERDARAVRRERWRMAEADPREALDGADELVVRDTRCRRDRHRLILPPVVPRLRPPVTAASLMTP